MIAAKRWPEIVHQLPSCSSDILCVAGVAGSIAFRDHLQETILASRLKSKLCKLSHHPIREANYQNYQKQEPHLKMSSKPITYAVFDQYVD